jgi:hypothetical protein
MISKTISGGVLALALLSTPAAHAAVINWGAHDATETFTTRTALIPSFANTFNFSLSSLSDLVASFSLSGLVGSATVSLRDGSGSVLGSFSASTLSSGSASFSNLAAGNYSYRVTGSGFLAGGTFTSTLTPVNVSPVPEPGSLAMLLAGLGMVGFIARRRRA